MNVKEYLLQITFIDSKIEGNKERIKRYKEMAEKRTSNLSPGKVQTSTSKEKMADAVCSYSDLEAIIKADEEKKQGIIDTISLLSPYESTVLYKRYVDNKTLFEISREMMKSYSWVAKVHSAGKKHLQKILNEKAGG